MNIELADERLRNTLAVVVATDSPLVDILITKRARGIRLTAEEEEAQRQLLGPLVDALEHHPARLSGGQTYFFGNGMHDLSLTEMLARGMVDLARQRGPDGAVAWLWKVATIREATVRIVLELYGVAIDKPVTFANGVTLHEMKDIADAPNAAVAMARRGVSAFSFTPLALCADILLVGKNEAGRSDDTMQNSDAYKSVLEVLRGLSLSEKLSPAAKTSWHYFVDSDYQRAQSFRMWQASLHEVDTEHAFPAQLSDADIEQCNRYIRLQEQHRHSLHVGLDRLAKAKLKRGPADKAIDGAIALEAFLGDSERNEMTHKVATRAALLLAEGEERRDVQKLVKQFYSARSSVVHGGTLSQSATSIVDQGVDVAARVAKRLVAIGEQIDHRALDLGLWPTKVGTAH